MASTGIGYKIVVDVLAVDLIGCCASISVVHAQSGYGFPPPTIPNGVAVTGTDSNGNQTTWPFAYGQNGLGGGGGGAEGAVISGTLQFQFSWQGVGPSPATVVLQVSGGAQWSGHGGYVSDGLGDSQTLEAPPYPPGAPAYGGNSSGIHYVVINQPGSGFTYYITPNRKLIFDATSH